MSNKTTDRNFEQKFAKLTIMGFALYAVLIVAHVVQSYGVA